MENVMIEEDNFEWFFATSQDFNSAFSAPLIMSFCIADKNQLEDVCISSPKVMWHIPEIPEIFSSCKP